MANYTNRRRRWTFGEKLRAAQEAAAPGMSVSSVARKYGLAPSQLFRWRKLLLAEGIESNATGDHVAADKEIGKLKCQIRELERLLGKKTLENELLKETMAMGNSHRQVQPDMGKDREQS